MEIPETLSTFAYFLGCNFGSLEISPYSSFFRDHFLVRVELIGLYESNSIFNNSFELRICTANIAVSKARYTLSFLHTLQNYCVFIKQYFP